ncbi:unnamed protein product [Clonostachys byssicola]|uniref:Uncharacterized protein n=1 Tax=Clonostachys byssicola TaxID=160290 RepID=A0A9N9XZN1_9HYPO|nr:unnamed protein product [Clonostachys byssicola]
MKSLFDYSPWCWGEKYAYGHGRLLPGDCASRDSLLHIACRLGSLDNAKTLLEFGARVNIQNSLGQYPLHLAMSSLDKVLLLFEHGADPNCRDNGCTPLHWDYDGRSFTWVTNARVRKNHLRSEEGLLVTREFIKRNADLEAEDDNNLTPLEVACFCHATKKLELILEQLVASPGVLEKPRSRLLPIACSFTNSQLRENDYLGNEMAFNCIPILCQYGFNINAQDENGIPRLQHLLSFGDDNNVKNFSGRTALHILAAKGNPEDIKMLADSGAMLIAEMMRDKHHFTQQSLQSIAIFTKSKYSSSSAPRSTAGTFGNEHH